MMVGLPEDFENVTMEWIPNSEVSEETRQKWRFRSIGLSCG
jgi:hypothetical protein